MRGQQILLCVRIRKGMWWQHSEFNLQNIINIDWQRFAVSHNSWFQLHYVDGRDNILSETHLKTAWKKESWGWQLHDLEKCFMVDFVFLHNCVEYFNLWEYQSLLLQYKPTCLLYFLMRWDIPAWDTLR